MAKDYNQAVACRVMNLDERDGESLPLSRKIMEYKDILLKQLYEAGDIACRHYKGLTRAGYNTLGEVVEMSTNEIYQVKNIGRKCIYPLLVLMKEKGIRDYFI